MVRAGSALGAVLLMVGCVSGREAHSKPPPSASPPEATTGRCHRSGWFRTAERLEAGDPQAARRLLRHCLGEVGGPSNAWRLLATLEADAQRLEEARRTLLRAVASHPEDAFAWAALGRLEAEAGRGALALGAFERAHQLRPSHEGLALERARALSRFGSDVERRAALVAPLMAEADGRIELGDVEGALVTLEAAQDLAGAQIVLRAGIELRRALVFLSAGAFEEAFFAAQQGLETLGSGRHEPRLRAELWVALSEAHLGRGEPRLAEKAARAAEAAVPAHPVAAVHLGLALLAQGQKAAAVDALIEALKRGLPSRVDRQTFVGLSGVRALSKDNEGLMESIEAAWPSDQAVGEGLETVQSSTAPR